MKPEAQRIAIAEACGWKVVGQEQCTYANGGTTTRPLWKHPTEDRYGTIGSGLVPNFLTDLNAMHEAESVIKQKSIYWYELCKVAEGTCNAALSTATQRAEAFLRTIGKWEDSA